MLIVAMIFLAVGLVTGIYGWRKSKRDLDVYQSMNRLQSVSTKVDHFGGLMKVYLSKQGYNSRILEFHTRSGQITTEIDQMVAQYMNDAATYGDE